MCMCITVFRRIFLHHLIWTHSHTPVRSSLWASSWGGSKLFVCSLWDTWSLLKCCSCCITEQRNTWVKVISSCCNMHELTDTYHWLVFLWLTRKVSDGFLDFLFLHVVTSFHSSLLIMDSFTFYRCFDYDYCWTSTQQRSHWPEY